MEFKFIWVIRGSLSKQGETLQPWQAIFPEKQKEKAGNTLQGTQDWSSGAFA